MHVCRKDEFSVLEFCAPMLLTDNGSVDVYITFGETGNFCLWTLRACSMFSVSV